MARETTIKFNFDLEKVASPPAAHWTLAAPGVTKSAAAGAVTTITLDSAALPATLPKAHDLILIDGSGLDTLDGELHRVVAYDATAHTVTIATDTFADTGTVAATLTDIAISGMDFDHVCLTDFSPSPGTPGEVDATTMCDDERVNLPGLPSAGTASFTLPFNMEDAGWEALRRAQKDGIARWFIGTTRRGQKALFHGVVSSFSLGPLGVEQLVTSVGNFTMDRSPVYMKAA